MNIFIKGKFYIPLSEEQKKELARTLHNLGISNREMKIYKDSDSPTIIEIPDNATNGDIIKALFNYEIVDDFHYSYVIDIENNGYYVQFDKEWWNAPYKKGENNE